MKTRECNWLGFRNSRLRFIVMTFCFVRGRERLDTKYANSCSGEIGRRERW